MRVDNWPYEIEKLDGDKVTFKPVVATIAKVFPGGNGKNPGWKFTEDTTPDGNYKGVIWNHAGKWNKEANRSEPYTGNVGRELLSILAEDIRDNRFLRLVSNMLKAGYLEDWRYNATMSGTPQGAIANDDDPRVKAAYEWARKHYTLAENPGMGTDGMYYYFHTFAKALDAVGDDTLVDASGASHDWRRELAERLFALQKDDGSWVNTSQRWLEEDPNLVTAYSLLALSYCEPKSVAAAP